MLLFLSDIVDRVTEFCVRVFVGGLMRLAANGVWSGNKKCWFCSPQPLGMSMKPFLSLDMMINIFLRYFCEHWSERNCQDQLPHLTFKNYQYFNGIWSDRARKKGDLAIWRRKKDHLFGEKRIFIIDERPVLLMSTKFYIQANNVGLFMCVRSNRILTLFPP